MLSICNIRRFDYIQIKIYHICIDLVDEDVMDLLDQIKKLQ